MPVLHVNNHDMYYEIHGSGEPVICSGGWGTFCHGDAGHLPRGLTDRYQVVIFDHRGIGQSTDDSAVASTTKLYADDVIGLMDALGITSAHLEGIIGIGACIFQEVAIKRPDLARSLVNTGCWARPDTKFTDQLTLWLDVHREMGFETFQRMVVMEGFDPAFYADKKDSLLGPNGAWRDLNGHFETHQRLTEAGLSHDTLDRLDRITAPTLVMHNGLDFITAPRMTLPVEQGIPGARGHWMREAAHVATGREARAEFCDVLLGFLGEH
jgi:pimeloyl-ACP methyl ester carboxylesterase